MEDQLYSGDLSSFKKNRGSAETYENDASENSSEVESDSNDENSSETNSNFDNKGKIANSTQSNNNRADDPGKLTKLSPWEIKQLQDAGWDHDDKDFKGKHDLWKDDQGNVYERAKNNTGEAEQTEYNIKNGKVTLKTNSSNLKSLYPTLKCPIIPQLPTLNQQAAPSTPSIPWLRFLRRSLLIMAIEAAIECIQEENSKPGMIRA